MLGRPRIFLEPRLEGALVVGPAQGGTTPLPGTLLPWARIRLANQPPTPFVDDESGHPLRAAWARPTLHDLARRASARALRRDLVAGAFRRSVTLPGAGPARTVLAFVLLLMVVCLVDMVLTPLGHGLIVGLPPMPTPADRIIATLLPATYFLFLAVPAGLFLPPATARRGRLTLTADDLTLAEPTGRTTTWRWADLAELRASTVLLLRPRLGPPVRISTFPGALAWLDPLIARAFPDQARHDAASLHRTLIRAAVLWLVGCAATAGVALAVGAGPAAAFKPLAASLLIPALGAAKVYGEPALRAWLTRSAERRARRSLRQDRLLTRAAGHASPRA